MLFSDESLVLIAPFSAGSSLRYALASGILQRRINLRLRRTSPLRSNRRGKNSIPVRLPACPGYSTGLVPVIPRGPTQYKWPNRDLTRPRWRDLRLRRTSPLCSDRRDGLGKHRAKSVEQGVTIAHSPPLRISRILCLLGSTVQKYFRNSSSLCFSNIRVSSEWTFSIVSGIMRRRITPAEGTSPRKTRDPKSVSRVTKRRLSLFASVNNSRSDALAIPISLAVTTSWPKAFIRSTVAFQTS